MVPGNEFIGLLRVYYSVIIHGGSNGKTLKHGGLSKWLDAEIQRNGVLIAVLHIIPYLTGKQQGIGGADPVLQHTGIAKLNILVPLFGTSRRFTLEWIDP